MKNQLLFWFCAIFCFDASAQQTSRIDYKSLPVEDSLFNNCGEVEILARQLSPGTSDRTYTIELFPRSHGTSVFPFPSEHSVSAVTGWIASHDQSGHPFAMFYSVNGAYAFRCRDIQNRFVESASPESDPFQITLTAGRAVIWHFDLYNRNMAHVFVVTDVALGRINGEAVLREITRRLGARFVFLYIRNDPWFFGYSSDSTPYIFADSAKALTEKAYKATETMSCMTGQTCRVGPSWE
jgi:hypothetical protein